MDTEQIRLLASEHGIAPAALDDAVSRVAVYYAGEDPAPEAVRDFLVRLPVWEKLGLSEETFLAYPATWRMAQAYRFQGPPTGIRQRPYRPPAPPEVRKEWEHLSLHEQSTKYREWCDEQPRPQP